MGYLALVLLVDETHETLMMVTNSLRNDLSNFRDHWVLINALTALANICSPGMARDLAPEVERLAEGSALQKKGLGASVVGHIRKKALLACTRMATRAPELAEQFKELPAAAMQDGNHAVVMASARSLAIRLWGFFFPFLFIFYFLQKYVLCVHYWRFDPGTCAALVSRVAHRTERQTLHLKSSIGL